MPDLPQPAPPPNWLERCNALRSRLSPDLRRLGAAGGGLVAAVVLAAVGWVAWRGSPPPPEMTLPRVGSAGDPGAGGGTPAGVSGPSPTMPGTPGVGASQPVGTTGAPGPGSATGEGSGLGQAGGETFVHAAGAVARPGLYRVMAGARVADVLDAAGGPTADADVDQINLAARVADGERLYVARRGETPSPVTATAGGAGGGPGPAGAEGRPVDLNTATSDQLDALPGVGPSTAQAIIEYRRQKGRFRSVEELIDVPGIGPAKLAQIRPRVRT